MAAVTGTVRAGLLIRVGNDQPRQVATFDLVIDGRPIEQRVASALRAIADSMDIAHLDAT